LVIAARCVACHAVLTTPTRGPVCEACWDAVPWYTGLLCPTCGAPRPDGATCRCDERPPHIAAIASAARYDGPMRAIVQAFKYAGHQSLGASLAARLSDHPHLRLHDIDVIVPVPLHPWRRLQRGFNQAERLARHLRSGEAGRPPVLHALVRLRWRSAHAGLPAEQRRRNLRGAVTLRPALPRQSRHALRARLTGARVLLVDDVVTTGGTLSACAEVLRAAGAREVRAATAARTARHG
jgi:ComF family protein